MCDYPNREAAMTVLATDTNGTPTVWCDPCITPLVKAMSGCDHGEG